MTQEEKDQLRKMAEHYSDNPLGGVMSLLLSEVDKLEGEIKLKNRRISNLEASNANNWRYAQQLRKAQGNHKR